MARGRAWTYAEDIILRNLIEEGKSTWDIGIALDRKQQSIRDRASYQGWSLMDQPRGGVKKPWTILDDDTLGEMLDRNEAVEDIAAHLGRTVLAVKQHCMLKGWSYRKKKEPKVEVVDPFVGPNKRPWMENEIRILADMWMQEKTLSEIGLVLERSRAAVQTQASHMKLPPHKRGGHAAYGLKEGATIKIRNCMNYASCKNVINSTWAGDRLCAACKRLGGRMRYEMI